MKKRKVTNLFLVGSVLGLLMVDIFLLLVWSLALTPEPHYTYSYGDTGQPDVAVQHVVCKNLSKYNPFVILLALYKLLLLLLGLYLAVRCWNVTGT
jgi:hypothetical protein